MERRWMSMGMVLLCMLATTANLHGQSDTAVQTVMDQPVKRLAGQPVPAEIGKLAAPGGTAFTYQGQLTRVGQLLTDTADLQFTLWDAATTPPGSQIGMAVYSYNVNVADGLFTTTIDFGSDVFKGDAVWLEIAVRSPAGGGTYTTLSPRQPLRPAPYALALPGLWTEQISPVPNILGGYSGNFVNVGAFGATIGGGGQSAYLNRVTDHYGTVGGGWGNQAGDGNGDVYNAQGTTIGGGANNAATSNAATVGGGNENSASGFCATVAGGEDNIASDSYTTIGGGFGNRCLSYGATIAGGMANTASDYATVGGGTQNGATNEGATVPGGRVNLASGKCATVGGGLCNQASGEYAAVNGGWTNIANGNHSAIGGGVWNTATGVSATIGGGSYNTAGGDGAAVPGGDFNNASGDHTFAAGRRAKAANDGAFVWADSTDADFASTTNNEFAVRATGGVRILVDESGAGLRLSGGVTPNVIAGASDNDIHMPPSSSVIAGGHANAIWSSDCVIAGGAWNQAGYQYSPVDGDCGVVGGGYHNAASGKYATLSGGFYNTAAGERATVGGGEANAAEARNAVVGGGGTNVASGVGATVAGGVDCTASGSTAAIGGGASNTASGDYSAIPGGESNAAQGDHSFAAGYRARALHDGAFVWADFTEADFGSAEFNEFAVRATGGLRAQVDAGGGGLCVNPDSLQESPTIVAGCGNNWATYHVSGAVVAGGGDFMHPNHVDEPWGTVSGGIDNWAAQYATVPGGGSNEASGMYSFAAGRRAKALHNGAFVWADSTDADFSSFGNNTLSVRATGGAIVQAGSGNCGAEIDNSGDGDGLRVYSHTSSGQNWAALYGVNYGTGTGVYGYSTQGLAGYFMGGVNVTGYLYKGGGGFKIDHPLDPQNKYLYHSFVESPDMKNVYDGVVTLGSDGRASVELPDWFEAVNRDFRYQLTAIGGAAPNLHISRKIANHSFEIAGGKAGLEVSWQVTGIRRDPLAESDRIPVEVDKPAEERGTYLHPQAYGAGDKLGLRHKMEMSKPSDVSTTPLPLGSQTRGGEEGLGEGNDARQPAGNETTE